MNLLKGITRFYEKADAVWTVNERTAGTLRSYGYKGVIDIIGNGIDLEIPPDYEAVRLSINKEYGIEAGEFTMLYVGQLVWHKNLRFIVEGLKRVKKAGKSFKMFFVGEGAAEDELKGLISKAGLKKQTIFTGKIDDRARLASIYARGDLFLFPSIYDTFGIVVREAAALRCPCLLIEGTNAAQGIIDSENGFLCSNDNKSFADAIVRVIENPEILKSVSENASKTLPESWESVVDRAYLKYQGVVRDYSKKNWSISI
jgi:glycosyltransferase involved in cell wall biosynthesis